MSIEYLKAKSTGYKRSPNTKSVVIDSRQRNCNIFKTPSHYTVDLGHVFKNVTSVELRGAIIPKSNYNIHSGNNKIDFAIGSSITQLRIIDPGSGYQFAPILVIASPSIGTTATAVTSIDSNGSINGITITNPGSGYTPSKSPNVIISGYKYHRPAIIQAVVGNHYTATLRIGEYDIGGNPIPPSLVPNNLLLEIQNSMNYAVTGTYDPISTSPFAVRLVSQYPEINAIPGTPESYDTNACLFNRIQLINVNADPWELLWNSGPNSELSAASVIGFNTVDTGLGILTLPISVGGGVLIPGGVSIRGLFDYNLKNDPDYVIMSVHFNNQRLDRIKGNNDSGLNEAFATLLFDNNSPETLHELSASAPGSITSVSGVRQLQGPVGKGVFWRDAGAVKPIKGYDFDVKKIIFNPPLNNISNITVQFTKYGYRPGGEPLCYNMEGREHVLMFEFTSGTE